MTIITHFNPLSIFLYDDSYAHFVDLYSIIIIMRDDDDDESDHHHYVTASTELSDSQP